MLTLNRGRGKRAAVLRTKLVGGRVTEPRSERRLPGIVNVYRGRTRVTGIPTFARVRYRDVYSGIDAIFHGRGHQLEYDFAVRPGADPSKIGLRHDGARSLRLARDGALLVSVAGGVVRQERPIAYQRIDGRRVRVGVGYRFDGTSVGFRLGRYDGSRPLVIDPVLSYSSYLGGSGDDQPQDVVYAPNNSLQVAGYTNSNDFPNATARTSRSDYDAFWTSINPFSGAPSYSTYIGTTGTEKAFDIAIDGGSNAYIVGYSNSSSFPVAGSTVDTCGDTSENAFMVKLNNVGTEVYGTCLGGSGVDVAEGVAVRSNGFNISAYVVGYTTSSNFPVASAYQSTYAGSQDAFLSRISFNTSKTCTAPCQTLPYSSYLGGDGGDNATGVAVMTDASLSTSADVFVVGTSGSGDVTAFTVPIYSPPSTMGLGGGISHAFTSAFVVPSSGSATKIYSYLYGGGNNDGASAIALTSTGRAFVVGSTNSDDLPSKVTSGNLVRGGGWDGFIAAIEGPAEPNPGYAIYSVYVGGNGTDGLNDVAYQNSVYAAGVTDSAITTQNYLDGQSCVAGNKQALLLKYALGASPPDIFSTCLGGSSAHGDQALGVGLDPDGGAWVVGETGSFPTVGAAQPTYGGGTADGFIAHVTQKPPVITSGPSGVVGSTTADFAFSDSEIGPTFECSTPTAGQLVAGTRSTGSCTTSTTAHYTGLAQGAQTFEVAAIDGAGSKSAPASRTFTVDTLAPDAFDLTSPDDAATTAAQPTFAWTASGDASGVSYQLFIDGHKFQDVSADACSNGTCSAQAATQVTGGAHTWKVLALDGSTPANTRDSSTRNFTAFNPPTARFTAAPNPALVGRIVTFDGSTSADGTHTITKYEWDLDGDGSFETDTGATATAAFAYGKAQTVVVGLKVTDSTGATGTSTLELKVNDPGGSTGPIGVSINKGAQYTNKPDVTLSVTTPPSTTQLLVANDGGFAGILPQPVSKEVAWKLDSSGPERLPKTVYVRFLTGPFASPNYTDDIILDERPPVVNSASVVGGAGTASIARLKTYTVKVKAKDSNSGVGFVQVTANKKKPGRLIKYKTKLKVKVASRPKFLRAQDKAGNFSAWKKLR